MLLGALAAGLGYSAPIRALIIDGQNNHDWKSTTPALKQILEAGAFDIGAGLAFIAAMGILFLIKEKARTT